MSERQPSDTEVLIQRYTDGELSDVERVAFEQRLTAEPAMQLAVEEARAYDGMFAAEREAAIPQPSVGFHRRVVEAARQLPVREDALATDTTEAVGPETRSVQLLVRRIVIAAVILFSLGFLIYAGVLRPADDGVLMAAPAEIRAEMDRLDGIIKTRLHQGPAVPDVKESGK